MDVKLTYLSIALLFTSVAAASNPFWNLITTTIELTAGYGVVNSANDAETRESYNMQWHFGIEIGQSQMIRLKFLSQGNNDTVTLDLSGTLPFIKAGATCYYFSRFQQIDATCDSTATTSGCEFINLTTTHLNLFYKSDNRPTFVVDYEYQNCLGAPLYSKATAETTTSTLPTLPTLPALISSTPTTTTNLPDTTTSPATAPDSVQTTSTNSTQKVDGRLANKPTDDDKNSGVTTQPTSTSTTAKTVGQIAAVDTNVIIIVVAVASSFILIVVLLLVYRKRFRKRLKALHGAKFTNIGCSEAPTIDQLYEEIAPRLPLRNMNMKEPGYEVPLRSSGSANEENSHGQSSQTVENELYLKPLDGDMPPTSQSTGTKYGSVVNELYHEDNSTDREINGNVVTKDANVVTLTNELYAESRVNATTNGTQNTTDLITERPQTPQPATTADSELDASVQGSSTVSNVLYNL